MIFFVQFQLNATFDNEYLLLKGERTTWHKPRTLDQILELKAHYPAAKIINGNTEVGECIANFPSPFTFELLSFSNMSHDILH